MSPRNAVHLNERFAELNAILAGIAVLRILIVAVDALSSGFVVNPMWYLWLGIVLWRSKH